MTDALKLFPDAAEAAARAFTGDPAIDSIVFRVFPDPSFPGPTDPDGFHYAAFYKTAAPATLYGVYASDELAAALVAGRDELTAFGGKVMTNAEYNAIVSARIAELYREAS